MDYTGMNAEQMFGSQFDMVQAAAQRRHARTTASQDVHALAVTIVSSQARDQRKVHAYLDALQGACNALLRQNEARDIAADARRAGL